MAAGQATGGAPRPIRRVLFDMISSPVLAFLADTLLVRPVAVPAPWYSVATGVLSIVVTLLLLGIAVALLGMARALKGAEKNLGGRMQGLADELIPLARNLNQIATQLSEATVEARAEIRRISGTINVVDDAVRDAIDAGESRLAQFGVLLDAVQDEAQATVASATSVIRGVRTGTGAMVSGLFGRNGKSRSAVKPRHRVASELDALDETDVRSRLAALEAALAALDDDDDDEDDEFDGDDVVGAQQESGDNDAAGDRDDDLDDEFDDALDGDDLDDDDTDDDDDEDDDDLDDDDDDDDDIDFDDDDDDDDTDDGEGQRPAADLDTDGAAPDEPRRGGPRIRTRNRA
jgi:hypothetical protein